MNLFVEISRVCTALGSVQSFASLGYDEEIKNVNFDVNLRHAEERKKMANVA